MGSLGRAGRVKGAMSHQEETEGQETGVLRRGLESLESFSAAMEQRVEMYALVLAAICLCVLFKILNVNNSPEKSIFYCANQKFLEEFLKRAPELAEPYIPTRFWGFSGHLQTIIQGVISRLHCPLVNGHRVSLRLTDGATVTVTSPRIFMYGNTADYAAMIKDVVRRFPNTTMVCVGFSMGGNLITKYLGEPRVKPDNIVAGISVCQGYDANRAMQMLLEWKGFRRLYIYAMTENMKSIIRRWHSALFTDDIKRKLGITERQVYNSATLQELYDVYTRKLAGFSNATDFYNSMSCTHHLKNIRVPIVFINSLDDPIVPPPLLEIVRDAALKYENMIFVEQKFGGHLGFYEGGFFYSNPLTWQDRMVIHIAHALVADRAKKPVEDQTDFEEENNIKLHRADSLDTASESETEFTQWGKLGPSLKLESFNTGMTSDCSSVDSTQHTHPQVKKNASGSQYFPAIGLKPLT